MINKPVFLRAAGRLGALALLFLSLFLTPVAGPAVHGSLSPHPPPAATKPGPGASPPIFRFYPDLTGGPDAPLYDTLTIAQRQQRNLPTALPASLPCYGRRAVYLTFDDGPDPVNTPAILGILRRAGVHATFFVVGNLAEKAPAVLRQTFREGHAIGNHSYTHVYRDIYQSPAAYVAQLRRTDNVLMGILGVRPRITRAPGGAAGRFTPEYWRALAALGYKNIGWNIDSGDACGYDADQIAAAVIRQAEKNKCLWRHAIVLMHDGCGHYETVRALPAIIKYFKDRDFEFRVVNLATPPAW